MRVAGRPVHLSGPAAAIKAGVVLVPEDRKAQGVVLDQTIGENLAFGNFDHVAPKGWVFPRRFGNSPRPASPGSASKASRTR